MKHKVDVDFLALYGRTGLGKSTLGVSLAIQYSLSNKVAPIVSNMRLRIPGVTTLDISHVKELLEYLKEYPGAIALIDEFDKSFSSNIGWLERQREQQLTELVSNARKYGTIALIATSQGKKKIRNTFRLNCRYVIEPTGTLDTADCPEYFIWNDVELYEESGKNRYKYAEFCSSTLPLNFLADTFETRETVLMEWQ